MGAGPNRGDVRATYMRLVKQQAPPDHGRLDGLTWKETAKGARTVRLFKRELHVGAADEARERLHLPRQRVRPGARAAGAGARVRRGRQVARAAARAHGASPPAHGQAAHAARRASAARRAAHSPGASSTSSLATAFSTSDTRRPA